MPEVAYDASFVGEQAEKRTLDVYVPQGEGPHAIVVWAHGGGYTRVSQDKGYNVGEFLQAQGYVVVLVGYRLSPAGRTPVDAAMEDYMAALAYVAEQASTFRGDPSRLVLMGHSSGGGMATRAAVNPYWLGTIGMSPADISLCVPIDQTGWNLERDISRSRNATTGTAETILGVVRDDRPEPGYAPVGETLDGTVYPVYTPLYDHPTTLYPDLDGRLHPRNLSVLYNVGMDTPRHWIPYSLQSAGRQGATEEFVAAMEAADRSVSVLELVDLNHGQMKAFIGRTEPDEARLLSDGLLEALGASTVSAEDTPGAVGSLAVTPNPARGPVRIPIGAPTFARVEVFDALGRRVATLVDGPVAGDVVWDPAALPPGVYHLRVLAEGSFRAKRVTVVR